MIEQQKPKTEVAKIPVKVPEKKPNKIIEKLNDDTNFLKLPDYKRYAIKRRFQGIPYIKIAGEIKERFKINVKEYTLKNWFWKGGSLTVPYRSYADLMIGLEIEETRDFIKGNLKKAAKILAKVMTGDGTPAQVSAAKEFLDRGLGRVPVPIDAEVKHSGIVELFHAMKDADNNDKTESDSG